jgi:fibronectin-binding autotransporter adhesin
MQSGIRAGSGTFKKIRNRRGQAIMLASACAVAGTCFLMQPQQAHAASGVWIDNATSGGLWSSPTNWSGGVIASGSGYTATFNTPSVANTVQLSAPYTIGGINFNDSSTTYGWTIGNNGSSSNILTLATTSGVPTITTTTAGTVSTINAPLAGTQGFSFVGPGNLALNSSSSTISGTAQVTASTSGTYVQDLNSGALGSLTAFNFTAGASGTSGMQILGGVTVPSTTPLNFNMNSGGRVDFDSIGSGTATINSNVSITNGNSSQITEFQMEGSNLTFNGSVGVTNYADANFQLRASAAGGSGLGTFNGSLTLPAGVTLLLNQDGGFGFTYALNSTGNSFTLFGETYGFLRTGVSGALPAASVYSDATASGVAGSCYLDLFGTNQTITGLNENSNGAYTIGSSSNSSASVLTLNNSTGLTYNYRGTIVNTITDQGSVGTQTVALAMQLGSQTLSGADTYSGGTTITGGTLNLNSSSALGTGAVVVTGTGTLDNVSGVYTVLPSLNLSGATITANSGVNATSNGAFGLPGTVTVGGTAASTIASGAGATNNYVQIGNTSSGSTTTFNVGSTGAVGGDLIVNVPIANYQSGSGFVAVANLLKTGAGSMLVNGVNTYTGTTNISAGTFALGSTASIAKSPLIIVGSSGTFNVSSAGYTTLSTQAIEGTGTITGVVTHSAGLIVPGIVNTSGGTLTFTNGLTLNGGALQFNLTATPGASANSLINVVAANGLTNNAATTALNINFTSLPTGSLVYPLFDYSGTLNGNWSNSNFAITSNAGRDSEVIDTSTPGVVNLDVTAVTANLIWASTSSQAWDIQTSKNWNNTSGSINPDYFYNGDSVTFDDTLGVQTAINIVGSVQPFAVSVTSNTNNFTFSGSGNISGGTTLSKTGSSILTIATGNPYSGATNISGGMVVLTNTAGNALGTGSLTIGSGAILTITSATSAVLGNPSILDNGTVNYNGSTAATFNVPINGSGMFTMNGSGSVALNVANNYSGGTTVNSGLIFAVGNPAAFGGATGGAVTINPSGQIYFNDSGATYPNAFNLNQSGSANVIIQSGGGGVTTITGPVTLNSASSIHIDGSATLIFNNTNALTSNNYGLTVAGDGGSAFDIGGNVNIGTGTLAMSTMLYFTPATGTIITVPCTITSASPVYQTGAGETILSGSDALTGSVNITGGILEVTNNNVLGTGPLSFGGGVNATEELALTGGINVSNAITVSGRSGAYGPFLDSLSGNNTISSAISFISSGNIYAIESDSGLLTISGQITQTVGFGSRLYVFQGAGNGLVTSPITNYTVANGSGTSITVPSIVMNGTGTWTFTGNNSNGGVTQANSGTLAFAPNYSSGIQTINLSGGLNISNGALVQVNAALTTSTRSLMVTSAISLGTTGKLDLANNDLDVQSGSLSAVTALVAHGFNGGTWNNTGGIVSTSAASSPARLTALGVIQNNQSGTALYTASNPFDGTTPGVGDVLVKYTYYGDANLDGKVDGSDYSLIDNAYEMEGWVNGVETGTPISGWFSGDFNYDNNIDGSDYTLIDNAFNSQGTQISALIASPSAIATAQIAGSGATSAVPEPASLGLLGIGVAGLLGRRRRR